MHHESPLRPLHEAHGRAKPMRVPRGEAAARPGAATGQKLISEVEFIPYGGFAADGTPLCEIVATFGEVELEYAAIRRSAGLMDCPHRGTLVVTGTLKDRREFLNRMVTQELKDLAPGMAKSAFWLNRKGRIEADLFIVEAGETGGMFIGVDIHNAADTVKTLNEFIVMEDVKIEDASSRFHHLAIHGKSAAEALAACGLAHKPINANEALSTRIIDVPVVIARCDQTGEPGYELIVPNEQAEAVWKSILHVDQSSIVKRQSSVVPRPIGWHAYNIARIEAGTPLFNIDFGSTNLPHETGVLRERVSFTKGCYLGQEIVARMENLGQPKHTLVGLRVKDDHLPAAGEQVFKRNDDGSIGSDIGVVTSSTLSPMLGAQPIAFAMLKTTHAKHGMTVMVNAEGTQAEAMIHPLRFWPVDEAGT